MSGVMLKTAIYGLLRVTFDLLHVQAWWWGVVALSVGLLTALFGVMFAAVQTDMKRLLAYSSIENIGIILSGVGLTILFHGYDMNVLAALALAATLYHCLNHALFKSLLFLVTGSVMHATSHRSLGKLGGLIRPMPWVAALALIGTLAIAGLPPLNGFASEWMLFQAFLLTPTLPNSYLNMLVPVATAALALAVALGRLCHGQVLRRRVPRPAARRAGVQAHDAGPCERAGLVWLAGWCVRARIAAGVRDHRAGLRSHAHWSAQRSRRACRIRAGCSSPPSRRSGRATVHCCSCSGSFSTVLVTFLLVRRFYHGRARRSAAWDCGFPRLDARMQDSAEGFGQPIKQIFEPFFKVERTQPSPFDARPFYSSKVEDRFWYWAYVPVIKIADTLSGLVGVLQHGRIHLYLIYSFATLLVLLLVIQ